MFNIQPFLSLALLQCNSFAVFSISSIVQQNNFSLLLTYLLAVNCFILMHKTIKHSFIIFRFSMFFLPKLLIKSSANFLLLASFLITLDYLTLNFFQKLLSLFSNKFFTYSLCNLHDTAARPYKHCKITKNSSIKFQSWIVRRASCDRDTG